MTEPEARSPMESQLRGGLVAVQVMGALLLAAGAYYVVHGFTQDELPDRADDWGVAIGFMLLPGTAVFLTARAARNRLARRLPSARTLGILAGIFTIVAALPFTGGFGGILGFALGLFTGTAAWLQPRRRIDRR